MKKLFLSTVFFSVLIVSVFAQVGIGTTTPNSSSILDLTATNKAFIPPRMTTAQRDLIASPVAGMVIFNTTTTCIEIYRGSGWYNLCTGTGVNAPAITSFAPTSGPVGTTVVITGTDLTGGTVKFNGTTATTSSVTATSITCTVPAGATTGTITVTTSGGTATSASSFTVSTGSGPTSDSVAKTNLVAHWTFDTDSKEVISGNAALTGGNYNVGTVTYNAGRIGNAATFVNGALVYPTIPNLNLDTALQSYTVSMWIKMKSREGTNTKWNSLFQLNSNAYTDLFGIIGVQVLNQLSKDTLALQIDQTQIDGTGVHTGGFGCGGCFGNGLTNPLNHKTDTTSWTLLTATYNGNGANQKLIIYANGVALDSLTLTTVTKPQTFRVVPTGGTTPPIPAAWANYVTIGTFNWSEFPIFSSSNGYGSYCYTAASRSGYMSNGINGSIDDIRVFNRPLTSAEITSLYTYGTAGK